MASDKMGAMRAAMTPFESKLKGMKPWRSKRWQLKKNKIAKREAQRREDGFARREAKREDRQRRHEGLMEIQNAKRGLV